MIKLPNLLAPVADRMGKLLSPWNSYLQQFTQAPPAIIVLAGASPFSYDVKEPGTIMIVGGTLTAVSLTRGADTLALGTAARIIPVAIDDTITITYSVVPTSINFVPSYGQNTTL